MRKRLIWLLAALLLAGCANRAGEETPVTPVPVPSTPTAAPTATPEPDPIRARMANMTLGEKVGQLFFIRPDSLDPNQPQAEINGPSDRPVIGVTDEVARVLYAYPVGGIILFGKNVVDPAQLRAFTRDLQASSEIPLFIGADEEGGGIARIANNRRFPVPQTPVAAALGAQGVNACESAGAAMGQYLRSYGLNLDFAPVADVNTNPRNPVIGNRAFSTDGEETARLAGAFARGLASQGVIPTLKHFPGHGDTAEDSHDHVAVSRKTAGDLMACEWLPYTENDLTGWAVMVGHIAVPALTGDYTPASLSGVIVTNWLRGELGFEGLVITDSLAMDAVTAQHSPGETAVLAVKAGCDMLLMPNGLAAAYDGVFTAVENGEISEERLDESVYRILSYKQRLGLL